MHDSSSQKILWKQAVPSPPANHTLGPFCKNQAGSLDNPRQGRPLSARKKCRQQSGAGQGRPREAHHDHNLRRSEWKDQLGGYLFLGQKHSERDLFPGQKHSEREDDQATQCSKIIVRNGKKNNTRDSNVVPHRSTNRARTCLTSLSRREAVLSCWYGRS